MKLYIKALNYFSKEQLCTTHVDGLTYHPFIIKLLSFE
jgi:hypothetical protein